MSKRQAIKNKLLLAKKIEDIKEKYYERELEI